MKKAYVVVFGGCSGGQEVAGVEACSMTHGQTGVGTDHSTDL